MAINNELGVLAHPTGHPKLITHQCLWCTSALFKFTSQCLHSHLLQLVDLGCNKEVWIYSLLNFWCSCRWLQSKCLQVYCNKRLWKPQLRDTSLGHILHFRESSGIGGVEWICFWSQSKVYLIFSHKHVQMWYFGYGIFFYLFLYLLTKLAINGKIPVLDKLFIQLIWNFFSHLAF